jgi:hypothetical protein
MKLSDYINYLNTIAKQFPDVQVVAENDTGDIEVVPLPVLGVITSDKIFSVDSTGEGGDIINALLINPLAE